MVDESVHRILHLCSSPSFHAVHEKSTKGHSNSIILRVPPAGNAGSQAQESSYRVFLGSTRGRFGKRRVPDGIEISTV